MMNKIRFSVQWILPVAIGACLLALLVHVRPAHAINALPTPPPAPGSYGLEATKPQPPPKQGASISLPGDGASFSESPIDVRGICPKGLLVEIYNNGVMAGAVMCDNGSFSIQISLFAGTNEIYAIVYDDLGQAGPKSNTVRVTYNNTSLTAFGELVTLTSSYGRRATPAGTQLTWPLQLSGGTGPYAFSIDWGDGTKPELKSQAVAGVVNIAHTYKKAGIYTVNIRVTDANGVSAFLQVIAVASGKVDATTGSTTGAGSDTGVGAAVKPQVLWVPTILLLLLLVPTYWLGRRSMLVSIRNKMLHERDSYAEEARETE